MSLMAEMENRPGNMILLKHFELINAGPFFKIFV
jgi:hypothetical protein